MMENNETKQLLEEAAMEIQHLRRENELMSAKLQMFDDMKMILHTQVASYQQGMSPDLLFAINKHLTEMCVDPIEKYAFQTGDEVVYSGPNTNGHGTKPVLLQEQDIYTITTIGKNGYLELKGINGFWNPGLFSIAPSDNNTILI